VSATIAPVESDVLTSLRSFIQGVVGNGGTSAPIEVIRGLANRTPMPGNAFIAMTPLFQNRLATTVDTFDNTHQYAQQSAQLDIQIDCYGPNGLSWATMLSTLLRDPYGVQQLAPTCAPLYAEDPRQIALVTGEEQYLERWNLTASFEYDPVTTITAQTADVIGPMTIINVDEAYP